MKAITKDEFLRWAAKKGIIHDPQYPGSEVLDFRGGSDERFWVVPHEPECRPYFLASLVDLMGNWRTCYVWRRLGAWPHPKHVRPDDINEAVELHILKALGVPAGTKQVVRFQRGERAALVTLLFSATVFGWSLYEDLYVIPNHARQHMLVSHHGVVHVSFPDCGELKRWVSKMSKEGFELPNDPPDATFKRPSWMGGGGVR